MTIVQFWLLENEMDRSQEKTKTRKISHLTAQEFEVIGISTSGNG